MGETLRGLLLNAWGWSLIGSIAGYAAITLYVAGGATIAAAFLVPATPARKRARK